MVRTGTLSFSAQEARVIAASLDLTAAMLNNIGDDGGVVHDELRQRFLALAGEIGERQ